ncbi:adhesion G protein-coupled receptor E5-like isoform 2-T2 [Polymixia lowei]
MGSEKTLLILGLLCVLRTSALRCEQGFSRYQNKCVDVDECVIYEPCGSNSICIYTEGDYYCQCIGVFSNGTTAIHGMCRDLNDCADNEDICGSKAHCTNAIGTYVCKCRSGYETLDNTSGNCTDIDECEKADVCGVNRICKNRDGGYRCECPSGYSDYGNEKTPCSDVDECVTDKPCGNHSRCINTEGAYYCQCNGGFWNDGGPVKFNATNGTCRDVDECVTDKPCGNHSRCINTEGAYYCQCNGGFWNDGGPVKFNATNGTCRDVDECVTDKPCGKHSSCINTEGAYYCQCNGGFWNDGGPVKFTATNGKCQDINECTVNKDICGSKARCNNQNGNYSCTCQSGYTTRGDRPTNGNCTDIDECEEADVCGVNGICENRDGSYWCECPSGYSNYGNEMTPCSELRCDQFDANSESLVGLADILSLVRKNCLVLSNPSGGGETNGDTLLEIVFTATDDLLSPGHLNNSDKVSGLLGVVEQSMKLIGPQLKDNHTRMEISNIEAELVVRKGTTPPTGPIHLTNENASLDTDWRTATGNGTYPGFALAALLSYKNLENSVNRSFERPTMYQRDGVDPSYQIYSKVVSAVVSNPSTQHLNPPVILTLGHLKEREESNRVSYICAYWKAGPHGQSGGGAWSTDGCSKKSSNATHTVCSCEHLSSFAVLMALYNRKDPFELVVLTKLGLTISLLCLAVCILTFKFCRSIQGTRTTIHLHVCVCLFIADLVFLTGISRTTPEGGCRFVAALLHLFFLGAFSWMLLEGVQLYRMVVLVFNANIRPLYLFSVGYGTPLVIVIISAISRPGGYGTDRHCWLSLEHGLIWSFFGPVCLIIILNIVFFFVTIWKLAQKFSSINPDLTNLHKIKAFTVTAIAQLCVLGLMWVVGAFLFQEDTLVPAYIFTVLNSLQGALIFVTHCLRSQQVRDEYAKFFCCICKQRKRKYDSSNTNPSSQSQETEEHGNFLSCACTQQKRKYDNTNPSSQSHGSKSVRLIVESQL